MTTRTGYALTLSCRDRPGIVAAVSALIAEAGFTIREAQQFDDMLAERFFMRVVFDRVGEAAGEPALRERLATLAARYGMDWQLRDRTRPRSVLILVSGFDHCLADLLYRHRIGELDMRLAGIVSNHPRDRLTGLDLGDAPFHHIPVEPGRKTEAEAALTTLIERSGAELVVLARYMQVLGEGLVERLAGRCINIHHSFLPGFKGAKPYHQAHARGVKLIGATAHYVTADLDEGPIIEQDVERVSHADGPDALIRKGRDIERRVLARAVRYHLDDRIILNGANTVVFSD